LLPAYSTPIINYFATILFKEAVSADQKLLFLAGMRPLTDPVCRRGIYATRWISRANAYRDIG
jgi:hypothetical protein